MFTNWTAPDGTTEFAICFDQQRDKRVLVVPALFDEANKLRRLTVEVMRRLDASGMDSFLPDLPGCHESLAPITKQSIGTWRDCVSGCADQFGATHIFSIRGGAMLTLAGLPGGRYSPVTGAKALRSLLRARMIASKEAVKQETTDELLETGRDQGLSLAGFELGSEMINQLAEHNQFEPSEQIELLQSDIGGAGLWLKAEPDFDEAQADALAAAIVAGLGS